MTGSPHRRWLLTALRTALCLGAIAFLAYNVTWYDYVRLGASNGPLVRLLGQAAGEFQVIKDGQPVGVPESEIYHVAVNGQQVPEIEYGIRTLVLRMNGVQAFWAIMLFFPVPLMAAVRLVWMLRVQKVHLSLWDSTKLTFAGNFFNFAMPGGMTGGDVIKAYYITRFTKHKTEAVTTIFLDRVIGLAGLVLMAVFMILFTRDPSQFGQLALPLVAILAGLAAACVVIYSGRVRQILRLRQIVERLPLSEQLRRIGNATLAMREHKLLVTVSLLITFALQTIVIISATIMAWALGMQGGFDYFFIYIAIGFLIAAIPISPPQAIGVMEFFYVLFFTADGLNTASQAFALAVAVRLIQLVWSVPGVLVPLLGAHLPKRAELAGLGELEAAAGAAPNSPAEPGISTASSK